jgi:hypothetical protein
MPSVPNFARILERSNSIKRNCHEMENNIMNTWVAVLHYSLRYFKMFLNVHSFINKNKIILWWTKLGTF